MIVKIKKKHFKKKLQIVKVCQKLPKVLKKKNEKKKISFDFRKNENIVNISEARLGENMHNPNYIDTKK